MKLKPAKKVASRKTMDETVILDLETSVYYSLNDTGTFLWERISAGEEIETLPASLAAEFDVAEAPARRHVDKFVSQMRREKLLVPA